MKTLRSVPRARRQVPNGQTHRLLSYFRFLVDAHVCRMHSEQVHSTATFMVSLGKCPMSCRCAGSWSKVTDRRSLRPCTSTGRTIAMRLLVSRMYETSRPGERCRCDMRERLKPRPCWMSCSGLVRVAVEKFGLFVLCFQNREVCPGF